MKPKKRFYCSSCRRQKILFKTQEEANLFIQYNKDEIGRTSDKVPSRSYYCSFCGGWHVTSIDSEKVGHLFERRDMETIIRPDIIAKEKKMTTEIIKLIEDRCRTIKNELYKGRFDYCKKQIVLCNSVLEDLAETVRCPFPYSEIRKKIETLYQDIELVETIHKEGIETYQYLYTQDNKTEQEKLLFQHVRCLLFMDSFEAFKNKIETLLADKQFEDVKKLLFDAENTLLRFDKGDCTNFLKGCVSTDVKQWKKKVKHGILRQERKNKYNNEG